MLHPIAKIMRTEKQREGILFFDTRSKNTKYLKLKEIYTSSNSSEFVGVNCTDGAVRLQKYYRNIGTLGDDSSDSLTVCQKIIGKANTRYLLVDKIGKTTVVSKEELLNMLKSDTIIAGAELQRTGRMLISSDVETVVGD